MRLSEAIRLGAMLHPQGFNALYLRASDGQTIVASCVLGAAEQGGFALFERLFGLAPPQYTRCPSCGGVNELRIILTHLNDYHRWTREAIADFVATIEPAECEPAPAADAVDPHAGSTGPVSTRERSTSSSSVFVNV